MIKRYDMVFEGSKVLAEKYVHLVLSEDGKVCLYDDIKDSLIVWHDIRENPDDLPPEETTAKVRGWSVSVWLLDNQGGYHYGYFNIDDPRQWESHCQYADYHDIIDVKIIAWAYPKPPKE